MEVVMQTIYPTSLTPNQYAEQEYHKQVKAPVNCPNTTATFREMINDDRVFARVVGRDPTELG